MVRLVEPKEGALRAIGPISQAGYLAAHNFGVELLGLFEVGYENAHMPDTLNLYAHLFSSIFTKMLTKYPSDAGPEKNILTRPEVFGKGTCLLSDWLPDQLPPVPGYNPWQG